MKRGLAIVAFFSLSLLFPPLPAIADRIGEVTETRLSEQLLRFLTLQDRSVVYALVGSTLIGLSCGVLGCFMVVQRMSLIGDTIGHAVLPGVCLGYLFAGEKAPIPIFVGATAAGVAGTYLLSAMTRTTRIPRDAAMGIVLSGFFGIGITLLTYIQSQPGGNKSGLNHFLFGQTAAFSMSDLTLMACVTLLVLVCVSLFYKEWLTLSFDADFASSLGMPTGPLTYLLMTCLAFSVVVAIQAVGVVLVSAMLITPAVTAYLLRERLISMLVVSAIFGCVAGIAGTFASFMKTGLPTGPCIVVAATLIFFPVYLLGSQHGVLRKWARNRSTKKRTERENTLKAIYHIFEREGFVGDQVGVRQLAGFRREDVNETRQRLIDLEKAGMAVVEGNEAMLTPLGYLRACEIVRNHRLWELYLVNQADIAADHVHDDAEEIEHILRQEDIQRLERTLKFPRKDPHGKPIPGWEDIRRIHVERVGVGADDESPELSFFPEGGGSG